MPRPKKTKARKASMVKLLQEVRDTSGGTSIDESLAKACRGKGGMVEEIAKGILDEVRTQLDPEEEK